VTAATRPRPRRRPRPRAARAADRLAARPRRVSPRARRRLLVGAIAGVLVAAVYLALVRNLGVFRVNQVSVRGAGTAYAPLLQKDLRASARTMTTLHVSEGELLRVARRFPTVVSPRVDAALPDRLAVTVVERAPVGTVRSPAGALVPVAADGTSLRGQPVDRPLPRLPGSTARGGQARNATAGAARLAGSAPPALAAWLEKIERRREGWVVALRKGPEVRFGSLRGLSAKWSAATAVLAARSARGAAYVDVRLPDRPSAGGFEPPSDGDSPAPEVAQANLKPELR
jgi:cell division protein FtsQ